MTLTMTLIQIRLQHNRTANNRPGERRAACCHGKSQVASSAARAVLLCHCAHCGEKGDC